MGSQSKNAMEKNNQPQQKQVSSLHSNKADSFFSGNFFQASLEVGKPDDPYEQEADKVSQQVVEQYDVLSGVQSNASADSIQTMLIQPMLFTGHIRRRMQRRLQKTPLQTK